MRNTDQGSTLRVLLSLTALLLAGLGFAVPAGAQTCPAAYTTVYDYQTPGGLLAGKISPAPSGQSSFPATRYSYDSNGRLQKVETGYLSSCPTAALPSNWTNFQVGKSVTYSYDANGNKVQGQVTGFYNDSPGVTTNITQFSYDPYDRLSCTAVRMNLSASLPSACAQSTQGSDGQDRITENSYDQWNRLTQVQKGVGTSNQENYVTYTYTNDGLQQDITDANGNESQLAYDGFDRLAYWYFPLKTGPGWDASDYEAYGYDPNGNRTSLRKRDGETITYQYDALNHVLLKQVPTASQDVYYGYDLRGLMLYALFGSTSGQGITNAYDGFGRLTSTTSTMGGTSLTVSEGHDNDGDRTSVTFPDGNYFDYDYDGLDRLSDVRENGSTTVVSEGYSPYGMLLNETRGGVTSSYDYEPAEKPQTWTDNFPAPANDVTTSLAYNPADEIITKTTSNDSYVYTGYANGTTNYSANGLNQYTNVASAGFAYDPNGNLTSDGLTGYTYDVENRVVSASGAHTATLTYDPLGRLFQIATSSATVQFLYDGDQMVAEYNGSGTLQRRYVHGSGADEPLLWYEGAAVSSTTRRSLQVDHQGSIDSVADASGNMIGINSYDEYGRPGPSNVGSFQYTGQVWLPELGIYYYKARMYDPRLGRFLQVDAVGYKADLDLYAYVGNDPIDHADPTGLCTPDRNSVGIECIFGGIEAGSQEKKGNSPAGVPLKRIVTAVRGWASDAWQSLKSDLLSDGPSFSDNLAALPVAAVPIGELGELKAATVEAEDAIDLHHAWPKYLGGAAKQDLVPLSRSLHNAFHSGLDKILPRQWGSAYYTSLSPAARQQVLQDLGAYTRAFDAKNGTQLYEALLRNGFPGP